MPGKTRYKYRCTICRKDIVKDDQQKHLKRHNFDSNYLKSSIAYKENFVRIEE